MALIIKDDEAKRLAHELAALTGESLAEAVTMALRERLERERRRRGQSIAEKVNALAERCAALPDVDPRSPDEIIGYDERGLPR